MDFSGIQVTDLGQDNVPQPPITPTYSTEPADLEQSNVPQQNEELTPVSNTQIPQAPTKPNKRNVSACKSVTKRRKVVKSKPTFLDIDENTVSTTCDPVLQPQTSDNYQVLDPELLDQSQEMDIWGDLADEEFPDVFTVEEVANIKMEPEDIPLTQQESGLYSNNTENYRNLITLTDDVENKENAAAASASTVDNKYPTISQDSMVYKHLALVSPNWGRVAAISMDPKTGDFTQFKIFKKLDGFFKRYQQISLRTIEAEKIVLQFGHFTAVARTLTTGDILSPLIIRPRSGKQWLESDDATLSHWYLDVHRSAERLVRVSFTVYDVVQPIISTYFQIKLFKRDGNDNIFKRDRYISMTLQELIAFSDRRDKIIPATQRLFN